MSLACAVGAAAAMQLMMHDRHATPNQQFPRLDRMRAASAGLLIAVHAGCRATPPCIGAE